MLNWEEVKEAIDHGQRTHPEEFEKHLANYVIQGFVDKITDEYLSFVWERTQGQLTGEEMAARGATFLTGIQIGWYLAEAALKNE